MVLPSGRDLSWVRILGEVMFYFDGKVLELEAEVLVQQVGARNKKTKRTHVVLDHCDEAEGDSSRLRGYRYLRCRTCWLSKVSGLS